MPTLRGAGRNSRRGISPRRVGLRLTPDELATCDGQLLTWAPKKRSWASRRWCSAQAPDRQDDERRRDRGRRCAAARRRLALLVGCRRAVRSHFDGDKPEEKLFLRTAQLDRAAAALSRCLRLLRIGRKERLGVGRGIRSSNRGTFASFHTPPSTRRAPPERAPHRPEAVVAPSAQHGPDVSARGRTRVERSRDARHAAGIERVASQLIGGRAARASRTVHVVAAARLNALCVSCRPPSRLPSSRRPRRPLRRR